MRNLRWLAALVVCAGLAVAAPPARAAFHFWKIQEVFSNSDGSVQFIELFCPPGNDFENFLNAHQITATSDGVLRTYTLSGNLPSFPGTGGRTFLIATPSFASLPGAVAPNYGTLPASFFNPSASSITINFAGVDAITFPGATLPKDGTQSLVDANPAGATSLGPAPNSPENFAGDTGSINVAVPEPSAATCAALTLAALTSAARRARRG